MNLANFFHFFQTFSEFCGRVIKLNLSSQLEVTARVLAESVLMFFGTRALLKRASVPTACRALRVLSTLLSTPERAQIQKS